MEDLEKQAIIYANKFPMVDGAGFAWLDGASSESAKQYWQQGMYSEEDMLNFSFWLLKNIGETSNDKVAHFEDKHYLNKWFERNKKK